MWGLEELNDEDVATAMTFMRQQQTGMEAWESLGEGMMDYFGNRLAGAMGGASASVSYEPLPLFGETDTQARYTLSQELIIIDPVTVRSVNGPDVTSTEVTVVDRPAVNVVVPVRRPASTIAPRIWWPTGSLP